MPEPEWSVEKDAGSAPERRDSWVTPGRVVAIVLAVLAVVFLVQNSAQTPVNVLFFEVRWPLWLVMAICIVIGMAVEWLWARSRRHRRR